jgi:type VI secretion system lysozyme-like protein
MSDRYAYNSAGKNSPDEKAKEQARYKPYLLSRVTDFEPHIKKETSNRLITTRQLKKDIFDNIEMLFNSRSHPSLAELNGWEDLENSVLGYGISDFCGRMHSKSNEDFLRSHILKQLQDFEPRMKKESIVVNFASSENSSESLMEFIITGVIEVGEVSEEVQFVSKIDLETGSAELSYVKD